VFQIPFTASKPFPLDVTVDGATGVKECTPDKRAAANTEARVVFIVFVVGLFVRDC
jgi:hypothetical protein